LIKEAKMGREEIHFYREVLMKSTRFLVLIIAIALVSLSSTAFAALDADSYFAVKGGVYSPSDSYDLDNFNAGETTHLDSKTGFAGEVVIGHYFLPVLAVELGAGYFESKGSPAAAAGEAKLNPCLTPKNINVLKTRYYSFKNSRVALHPRISLLS
jgi:hypothetical protein